MINPKMFDDLIQRLVDSLPEGARNLQRDAEKNLRATLNSTFNKLNLVTREEFEIQEAVLARTREKLKVLESQVAALEASLGHGTVPISDVSRLE